ncbi:MAG: hypothetical protein Q4B65_00695 [Candidatus Saccharibacteria bacterium]|nr:hypothetical protein [Candidatus Saccharibacteria bacterium]
MSKEDVRRMREGKYPAPSGAKKSGEGKTAPPRVAGAPSSIKGGSAGVVPGAKPAGSTDSGRIVKVGGPKPEGAASPAAPVAKPAGASAPFTPEELMGLGKFFAGLMTGITSTFGEGVSAGSEGGDDGAGASGTAGGTIASDPAVITGTSTEDTWEIRQAAKCIVKTATGSQVKYFVQAPGMSYIFAAKQASFNGSYDIVSVWVKNGKFVSELTPEELDEYLNN